MVKFSYLINPILAWANMKANAHRIENRRAHAYVSYGQANVRAGDMVSCLIK